MALLEYYTTGEGGQKKINDIKKYFHIVIKSLQKKLLDKRLKS